MRENDISFIKVTGPDGKETEVHEGISILELSREYQKSYKSSIIAAKVNNDIKELSFHLYNNCKVDFIDLTKEDGMRIYRRSLYFILIKAVNDIFPDRKVVISHTITNGVYCEIKGDSSITDEGVKKIKARMNEIIDKKIPFVKKMMSVDEAKEIFAKNGRMDRYHAIEHRRKPYVTMYNCGGFEDYFYGYMAPDTSYVKLFDIKHYAQGVIVVFPVKSDPTILPEFRELKKLFNVFVEYKNWGKILGVANVGALNDIISDCKTNEFIRISEALHEKKIANIADMIYNSVPKKRIVLISGPSSSGKTTFAQRLSIQLRVCGLRPVTISLDDYFVDRDATPKDEDGEYDFEALDAIDVPLFNQHLADLISGKEVEMPTFNFHTGCRGEEVKKFKIDEDQVIVIEGIHGLNEKLSYTIPRDKKFKIYVSALTSLSIDDHNRIPTTDTRVIRRIVRDFQFRGCSALNTLKRWASVRRGEEKNIFPFQEEADIMFNSSLIYELGVLKTFAEPLLAEITTEYPEYSEAKRLIEFLSYFLPIETNNIPQNSIIREFAGGSCFY